MLFQTNKKIKNWVPSILISNFSTESNQKVGKKKETLSVSINNLKKKSFIIFNKYLYNEDKRERSKNIIEWFNFIMVGLFKYLNIIKWFNFIMIELFKYLTYIELFTLVLYKLKQIFIFCFKQMKVNILETVFWIKIAIFGILALYLILGEEIFYSFLKEIQEYIRAILEAYLNFLSCLWTRIENLFNFIENFLNNTWSTIFLKDVTNTTTISRISDEKIIPVLKETPIKLIQIKVDLKFKKT